MYVRDFNVTHFTYTLFTVQRFNSCVRIAAMNCGSCRSLANDFISFYLSACHCNHLKLFVIRVGRRKFAKKEQPKVKCVCVRFFSHQILHRLELEETICIHGTFVSIKFSKRNGTLLHIT